MSPSPQTLPEFLALLRPGQSLLILASEEFFGRFLPIFLTSGTPPGGFHILTLPHTWSSSAYGYNLSATALDKSWGSGNFAARLSRMNDDLPRSMPFVFDLSAEMPRWLAGVSGRLTVLEKAIGSLKESRRSSLWFIPEPRLADVPLSRTGELFDYSMVICPSGQTHYAQFVRGAGPPELFLPRLVGVEEGQLLWSNPLKPSEEVIEPKRAIQRLEKKLQESEALHDRYFSASPLPQAVFTHRQLLRANEAFFDTFSWLSRKRGGKSPPHDFFGRAGRDFFKEVFYHTEFPSEGSRSLSRPVRIKTPSGGMREYTVAVVMANEEDRKIFHCTFHDITAHSDTLEELRKSDAYHRSLLETSISPLVLLRAGKISFANKGFLELFGYMFAEEVIDKELADFAPGRDRKTIEAKTTTGDGTTAGVEQFEITGIRKDRAKLYLKVFAQDVTLGGKPGVLCSFWDRTREIGADQERARRGRDLEMVEKIMTSVHQSLEVQEVASAALDSCMRWLGFEAGAVYTLDADTEGLTMVAQQGFSDKMISALGHQNIKEGLTGFLAKTLEPSLLKVSDYPPYLPHGSLFEGEAFKTLAFLPLVAWNALAGVLLLCGRKEMAEMDVSQHLLRLVCEQCGIGLVNATQFARVRASEAQYVSAVEEVHDVIYMARPNGTYLFLSPRVVSLVGYPATEFLRAPEAWRALVHPDDRSEYSRRISSQANGTETIELSYRVLPKGKASYRWVRDAVRYARAEDGELLAIHGVLSDITDTVEAARSQAEGSSVGEGPARDAGHGRDLHLAETLGTMLPTASEEHPSNDKEEWDEFVRLVAHNLKEPLVNIEGYARLLRDEFGGRVGEEGKGFLDTLLHLSGHTKGLLDDLNAYARLKDSQPEREELQVGEVLAEVLGEFEFTIREKGAVVELDSEMPVVRFNRSELQMVFRSLISNALKFGGEMPPRVEIEAERGEKETVFRVRDNGIGVSRENLERVFGPFQRIHSDDLYPGTGIGLAIVKRIVDRHGGRVWLESEERKGTTAFFTVPD